MKAKSRAARAAWIAANYARDPQPPPKPAQDRLSRVTLDEWLQENRQPIPMIRWCDVCRGPGCSHAAV